MDSVAKLDAETLEAAEKLAEQFCNAAYLEVLRQLLRRELRIHGGQRAVAEVVNVDRAVIRKLLDMSCVPQRSNLEKLELWAEDRPEIVAEIQAVCFAILVDGLPPAARKAARHTLASMLILLYAESGQTLPAWLTAETGSGRISVKRTSKP